MHGKEAALARPFGAGLGMLCVPNDIDTCGPHQNPTQMRMLRKLAFRLVRRMNRYCSDCLSPGFGLVDTETGLPCGDCGLPTRLIRWEIHGCPRCLMKKQSLVQMDSLALLLVTATYAIHEEK